MYCIIKRNSTLCVLACHVHNAIKCAQSYRINVVSRWRKCKLQIFLNILCQVLVASFPQGSQHTYPGHIFTLQKQSDHLSLAISDISMIGLLNFLCYGAIVIIEKVSCYQFPICYLFQTLDQYWICRLCRRKDLHIYLVIC